MKRICQAVLLALLTACSTATTVTGQWQGDRTPAFKHLLIVGVSANSRMRRSFEIALGELIRARGTLATAAIQAGDGAATPTPDGVTAMARALDADGVLVTRLASRKVSARESESRIEVKTQQPVKLDGSPGLVELFSLEYNEYEDPGELSAKSTAVLESSLYDMRQDDRLAYVITTTAKFREDRDDVVDNVTRAIAAQLQRAGLIR
ncbi:hypothetical protein GPROT2_01533 [Gammaproteobacteria bacterium]|nr:hypothetical protein [Gammaproteobacteria bacterium]QOJ31740.1 MAG: hypothetical protein HRU81_06305 [Gammaproteobacteria bacterium]CAG0941988.1 hypothetical protein GPROT2_01533 [Gammaproteobacteria bacterium]